MSKKVKTIEQIEADMTALASDLRKNWRIMGGILVELEHKIKEIGIKP